MEDDKYTVSGDVRSGGLGSVTLARVQGSGVWQQRAAGDSTRHLNRDYNAEETLESIVETWLPVDWKRFVVEQNGRRIMWPPSASGSWGDA